MQFLRCRIQINHPKPDSYTDPLMQKPSLLITQSFIVSSPGSYWDYRDYIFCLASNLSIKNLPFRLNIEQGVEWVREFERAAEKFGFSDFEITCRNQTSSWSDFMVQQIDLNDAEWAMPWPGDHIYVHPDDGAFVGALEKAEQLDADAVVYSHMQDFEYFLDWNKVKVLYVDSDYIMMEWGKKHHYFEQNPRLRKETQQVLRKEIRMPPVPGFAIYRSPLLREIVQALPPTNHRWQAMEYSHAPAAWAFRLLIPKQCLYRHVHGYWLEGFFKYRTEGCFPTDVGSEIRSWYIPTEYDFDSDYPTRHDYRNSLLEAHPYYERYFKRKAIGEFKNPFGASPFDADWEKEKLPLVSIIIHNICLFLNDIRNAVNKLKQ